MASVALATGAAAQKPLGIADVLQLELATDPRLSPDARHLVYVRQFVDPIADQRRSNLWIVGADGTGEPATGGTPRQISSGDFDHGMVGDEDYRTPPSEAEQYYQALKLRGVESRLVKVPGEPHGIARRPSHHMAKVLALIDWFASH